MALKICGVCGGTCLVRCGTPGCPIPADAPVPVSFKHPEGEIIPGQSVHRIEPAADAPVSQWPHAEKLPPPLQAVVDEMPTSFLTPKPSIFEDISPRKMPRQLLLDEAYKITSADRNKAYGNPEDNFQNIADYWFHYLFQRGVINQDAIMLPQDVANMMILMKMARLACNMEHRDSILDIAGYAACGEDCRVKHFGK